MKWESLHSRESRLACQQVMYDFKGSSFYYRLSCNVKSQLINEFLSIHITFCNIYLLYSVCPTSTYQNDSFRTLQLVDAAEKIYSLLFQSLHSSMPREGDSGHDCHTLEPPQAVQPSQVL